MEDAEDQEPAVQVANPPLPDEAMLLAGKAAYEEMKCARCHGKNGTGDGPSADELEDDNGLPIMSRDFTDASQFIGPSNPKGLYRTFTTGLDGAPMPSYADFLDERQRWQLVWYVMSCHYDLTGISNGYANASWIRDNSYNSGKKNTQPFLIGYFGIKAWRCPTLTWGDPTLPSALSSFTSEFEMDSGGSYLLLPPDKLVEERSDETILSLSKDLSFKETRTLPKLESQILVYIF